MYIFLCIYAQKVAASSSASVLLSQAKQRVGILLHFDLISRNTLYSVFCGCCKMNYGVPQMATETGRCDI